MEVKVNHRLNEAPRIMEGLSRLWRSKWLFFVAKYSSNVGYSVLRVWVWGPEYYGKKGGGVQLNCVRKALEINVMKRK